ncbi:fructosamine kinase family protein [Christiangramia sp. SM2212]|uniref:Fructosamine kinase family protein n=1 Tax=Christiangramia sediminicola TaxID=3073267 RepID=A0ABU1EM55_9FLAO|nr:fructosamine kinase family protein [Christiangramia sp. SM2212]MDR5589465.1 fructosamine kinase family protein [Christiangramia sp. SM2212]
MIANNTKEILHEIATDFGEKLTGLSALTGGDINEVFLIETNSGKFVVKLNDHKRFPGMFDAEKSGLEKLRETKAIDIPETFKTGISVSKSYLILEFKESASKTGNFWDLFGEQMAQLHLNTSEEFGYEKDNYIGSLPQYNETRTSAAEFYIEMRLQPQIEMAERKGFDLKIPASFYKNLEQLIPNEPASLVHGDLWNGNFITNSIGQPCLIDPAVAYAPREMDLGMMKLFGGFNESLFEVYMETYPLQGNWQERIPLWQLYYLLVHLNIFGAGYKSQVTSIIRKYS